MVGNAKTASSPASCKAEWGVGAGHSRAGTARVHACGAAAGQRRSRKLLNLLSGSSQFIINISMFLICSINNLRGMITKKEFGIKIDTPIGFAILQEKGKKENEKENKNSPHLLALWIMGSRSRLSLHS